MFPKSIRTALTLLLLAVSSSAAPADCNSSLCINASDLPTRLPYQDSSHALNKPRDEPRDPETIKPDHINHVTFLDYERSAAQPGWGRQMFLDYLERAIRDAYDVMLAAEAKASDMTRKDRWEFTDLNIDIVFYLTNVGIPGKPHMLYEDIFLVLRSAQQWTQMWHDTVPQTSLALYETFGETREASGGGFYSAGRPLQGT